MPFGGIRIHLFDILNVLKLHIELVLVPYLCLCHFGDLSALL